MNINEVVEKVHMWLNDWCPGCGEDARKGELTRWVAWNCPRCRPLRAYLNDLRDSHKEET